jgi:hypothetical protein
MIMMIRKKSSDEGLFSQKTSTSTNETFRSLKKKLWNIGTLNLKTKNFTSMKKINAFDIETIVNNEKKLIPYCICYTDNNEYKSLYGLDCIKKFINFLMTQNDKIYYAHNLTFDGSFIIKELANASIDFILFLSKNHIYYIKIKKNNIELKCSYMLFPYSLHKAQKILKCNTKLPFSVKEINFDNFENMNIKKQVIDYCINDVKLVMELLHIYDVCISPVYPN